MRRIPTTIDYLAYHAATRPDATALVDRARPVSFAALYADARRTLGAVDALRLPRGAVVAVEWDGLARHWLMLMACEALGLATASYPPGPPAPVLAPLFERADLVAHVSAPPDGARRLLTLDAAWWAGVARARPTGPPPPPPPDLPRRVTATSGTTGSAKLMALSARQMEARRDASWWRLPYSDRSRLLVSMAFSVQASYIPAGTCLRAGGACVYDAETSLGQALTAARATHAVLLPRHVASLVERPDALAGLRDLHLFAVGGRVPGEIRDRLLAGPAAWVVETYATNESGTIATMDRDGVGTVLPEVEMEIVDEAGAAVPVDALGEVRVRAPGMIAGYLDDAPASAARFRDGWFHPGDVARHLGPRRFRLEGRRDDILNLAGLKLFAPQHEDALRALAGVRDAALAIARDAAGRDALRVFVTLADGAGRADVARRVATVLSPLTGTPVVEIVAALPRTETGKLARGTLGEWAARPAAPRR